jgi:hypothetical protein
MRRRELIAEVVSAAECALAGACATGGNASNRGLSILVRPARYKFVSFNRAGGNVRQIKKKTVIQSITSSANTRRGRGTSSPRAFAVLRLMTSSYLVGA